MPELSSLKDHFKWDRAVYLIGGGLLFLYVLFRGIFLDITHDEAYSFYLAHHMDWNGLKIMANNHWLNTIFLKIPEYFGAFSPGWLRWHNMLSFLIYLFFTYRIVSIISSTPLRWLGVALMLINPFTLEYFSLARGYSLALALNTGVIYYLVVLLQSERNRAVTMLRLSLCGFFSVMANYSGLFQFTAAFMAASLFILMESRCRLLACIKQHWLSLVVFLFCWWISVRNLLNIKYKGDDLRYGADHSFFSEALSSMWATIFSMDPRGEWKTVWQYPLTALSILLFGFLVWIFVHSLLRRWKLPLVLSFIFLFNFAVSQLLHFLYDTPFPLFRTFIVQFPPMALAIAFYLWNVSHLKWTKPIKYVAISVALACVLNFFSNLKPWHSYYWSHQAQTTEIISFLKEESTGLEPCEMKILTDRCLYPVWVNYYSKVIPNFCELQMKHEVQQDPAQTANELKKKTEPFDYLILSERNHLPQLDELNNIYLIKELSIAGVRIYGVKKGI